MRILHIISSPASGGAEVYVKDLVLELKKTGNYVAVGFLQHAADSGRGQDYEDSFLLELDTASIPYFFIGHEARKQPWLGALRVRKYVKKHRIDVYHAHLPYGVVFGSLLGVPCVYTHHTIEPRMSPFQYYVFNKLIDCYVGISRKCSEMLGEYTGRYVTIIQNGVDLGKIKIRDRVSGKGRVIEAVAVGRITPQKNYYLMVDAVSMLPADMLSCFNLRIAGEGTADETNRLLAYIKTKGLESQIKLLGNRSDIPDVLSNSDVFLMSSAWEGLPIALIEAAATGLPCLVTDVGGCYEVIDACANGYVVNPDDVETYAGRLTELISNGKLREEFSRSARINSHVFSIENSAKLHGSLYSEIFNGVKY